MFRLVVRLYQVTHKALLHLLFSNKVLPTSQAFNDKLLALRTAVNILDVIYIM